MAIIKTITCHDVYNHGASLQAYALQRYLKSLGYPNEIIDYKPPYLSGHYHLWKISNPAWDKNFISRLIYRSLKLPGRLLALRRKKAFDQFTREYLKLTVNRYASNEQLKANCPQAEIYIAGSDQIWNTLFENGKDPAFYLDFVPPGKKKISYAASFATEKIVNVYEPFVKEQVGKLDSVSVREQSGLTILQELGITGTTQVADPVFLLDQQDWNELATHTYLDKYLLVYATEKSETLQQVSIALAQKMDLKIYSAGSFKLSYANRNFNHSGPLEFVSLIKHAEYVISNSFHATAFAIIFQKNLCVVNRSEAINSRMRDLLAEVGLARRLADGKTNLEDLVAEIDFNDVNKKIKISITHSKQYLKNALNPIL